MNQHVKELVKQAILSDDYPKIENALHNEGGFDFGGMLCDLHAKETSNKWRHYPESHDYEYLGHSLTIPTPVLDWAGLSPNQADTIMNRNDHSPETTFQEVYEELTGEEL